MKTKPKSAPKAPKSTNEELAERIEFVERLISEGLKPGQIKRLVLDKFGVGYRQCEVYASRARDNIRKRFGQNKDQHRKDSFAFYEAIAAPGSKASAGARLRARQRIDELLGLDAPRVTQLQGPDGGPVQTEDVTERKQMSKEQLRAMLDIVEHGTRNIGRLAGNGAAHREIVAPTTPANGNGDSAGPGSNGSD